MFYSEKACLFSTIPCLIVSQKYIFTQAWVQFCGKISVRRGNVLYIKQQRDWNVLFDISCKMGNYMQKVLLNFWISMGAQTDIWHFQRKIPNSTDHLSLKPGPLVILCEHMHAYSSQSVCCLMCTHPSRPAPSDKQVWYTLWLSDRGPPGKAGWSGRGVVCILGHFMKKGCNHGSKPRGGLNYAWLNKAQGYQRAAMSQQTLPHSGAPDSKRTPLKREKKKVKETKKQTRTQEPSCW